MTLFIVSVLSIIVASLFLLARPLLKTRNTLSYERHAQNIHYAKERIQELEEQLKNASISATDYEALKLEIESNLASDIDLASQTELTHQITPSRSNKILIGLLSVMLPLSAVGLYWLVGTPSALTSSQTSERPSPEDVNKMLSDIKLRLEADPSDTEGWTVLSRTYLALGRFREARNGFLKLLELDGESADILVSLADASGLMAGGDMSGEPTRYIERALELEPSNPQALWLAGLSAAQQNKAEKARSHWNKLLPLLAEAPQQQEELRAIIQQTLSAPSTTFAAPDSQANQAPANTEKELLISVSVAPTVLAMVSPDDTVFVFARAKDGPPAPLAVKQLTVADLPITISLSDSDAMMPQLKMSLFEDLVVSARVAVSGDPIAQKGDIQSAQLETKNDAKGEIDLEIDTVLE